MLVLPQFLKKKFAVNQLVIPWNCRTPPAWDLSPRQLPHTAGVQPGARINPGPSKLLLEVNILDNKYFWLCRPDGLGHSYPAIAAEKQSWTTSK